MTSVAFPLFTDAVIPLLEGHYISQAPFALGETMLAASNHLPVFYVFRHTFQEDQFCDLTGH